MIRHVSSRTLMALVLCALTLPALAAASDRAAPVNTVSPTITGKPRVGQTLSASEGEWQGAPTAFFYQWLRCDSAAANCVAVAGAVGPQYGVTAADLGAKIRVEVVAENGDGSSPARRSAATAVIRIERPTNTVRPTIAGTAREGQALSTTTGEWTGSPTSFTFQWKRCVSGHCAAVAGATAATYALGAADVGTRIRVRVDAHNDGGATGIQSTSTATVASATAGLRLGPAHHDRRRGIARFRVAVPSAGLLTLTRTGGVRGERRHVPGARSVRLTVRPRGQALRRLHRRGRVRVRVVIRFAADAGAVAERHRRVTLRG